MFKFSVISTNATFNLVRNTPGVNEGQTFNITLNATGVQNGQLIPYTITGIDQLDIQEPLTGYFVVQNGQANKTFTVLEDATSEGEEIFTITLDSLSTDVSVTINDTSTSGPTDPYFSNVASLLHFDGNLTDQKGLVWTAQNGASTSGTAKFGSGALSCNGSNQLISTPSAGMPTFGAGDWTVEFWCYFNNNSPSNYEAMIHLCPTAVGYASLLVMREPGKGMNIFVSKAGDDWNVNHVGGILNAGQYYHVAIVRNGIFIIGFLNGTPIGAPQVGAGSVFTGTANTVIGNAAGLYPLNGFIDDFRITNGIARYTSAFTPPTSSYADQ